MRFSASLSATFVVSLVAAHGDIPGMPKVFGLAARDIALLKSRNIFDGHLDQVLPSQHSHQLKARQGGDSENRCGPEFGCATCAEGFCCSPAGYCGTGSDFCQSPDCQFNYGPGCDANKVPGGGSTRATDRSAKGGQPLGGDGIDACVTPGTVAITYDDGPYIYTDGLLDLLSKYSAKATFFITGINLSKGAIDQSWSAVIKRMDSEGHQVASHTWSHQDLSVITSAQRYDQMIRNEMAITNILGKFPVYMRPPYSSCTAASGCQSDLAALGYVISSFDLDTDDYNHLTREGIQIAKDNVYKAMNGKSPSSSSFLSIAHDIHELTAVNLTSYMLDYIKTQGYKMVTLGECLGVTNSADWYRVPSAGSRTASTSSFSAPACASTVSSGTVSATVSAASSTATAVSVDATCGGTSGYQCVGFTYLGAPAECCSASGYCGNTADHCGSGCQSGFGKCGSANVLVSSSSNAQPSSAAPVIPPSSAPAASSPAPATTSPAPAASSSAAVVASSIPASSTVPPAPSATSTVSKDGTCGGTKRYTCAGSTFGSCCSQSGQCGRLSMHCGTGCNPLFGTCTSQAPPPAASPTPATKKVSTNGKCGGTTGLTCSGSWFGLCCGQNGMCGSTLSYCMARSGCQNGFGTCI